MSDGQGTRRAHETPEATENAGAFEPFEPSGLRHAAFVLTTSDRSSAGTRADTSGAAVAACLRALGFTVDAAIVPDEQAGIEAALRSAVATHALVVTTGGTGLTPRDVTPQATLAVIDYEVPGLAEAMRAEGRRFTPMAALSRAVVGVAGRALVVNLPGSPRGATESLDAIVPVLDHALDTLAGPYDHATRSGETDGPETTT
jgi:molybdenum cofactor synthesis domain-containing protein